MKDFFLLMPEVLLALTLALVVVSEITYHGERLRLVAITGVTGMAAALVQTIILYQYGPVQVFGNVLSIDGLSLFFKLLFITLGALALITSTQSQEIVRSRRSEYCALIIASSLAMCFASAASDVLLMFLSLQFANVIGYVLAGFGKKSARSTEAAVKYMAFCFVSAAFLLYGLALLFSATHSLNIYEIHKALVANPLPRETMLVIFMLVFLALGFQMAAFPMYLWAPDVLEGAPTPVSGFLSVGSRAVGFAVALRFFISIFAQPFQPLVAGQWQVLGAVDWTEIVALISGLTMACGAFLALRQKSSKRMVGCLAVAQTGYLLMGLLVLDQVGIAAILYNLVIELFSLMGIFTILSFFYDELKSDRLEDLQGMLGRYVPECICLVLFLLCLVGVPPLPGFIGKFALIGSAIRHKWLVIALLAIGTMTVSSLSIARLAFSMIGDFGKTGQVEETLGSSSLARPRRMVLAGLTITMALVGVFAEPVLGWAGKSLDFIFW